MYKEKSVTKQAGFTKDDTRDWEHKANLKFIDGNHPDGGTWQDYIQQVIMETFMEKYASKYDEKDYWISTAGVPEGMKNGKDSEERPYLPEFFDVADDNIMKILKKKISPNQQEEEILEERNDIMEYYKNPSEVHKIPPEGEVKEMFDFTQWYALPDSPEVICSGGARYNRKEKFGFCWHEGFQKYDREHFCPKGCRIYVDPFIAGTKAKTLGLLKVEFIFEETSTTKASVPDCHQFKNKSRQIRFKNGGFSNLALCL